MLAEQVGMKQVCSNCTAPENAPSYCQEFTVNSLKK
jgi:hypothetical protein